MLSFMSYQTADREIAARVAALLKQFGCGAFMAHDDIEVSDEWRLEILRQLEAADLFVAIISSNYYSSPWCLQESGIAAFRRMTLIPLSTDGAVPPALVSHIQSTRIDPAAPTIRNLLPGLARHDLTFVIDGLISIVAGSHNYRSAEANFELIQPYIPKATKEQIVKLLNVSTANDQVCNAGKCAIDYLPPLVATHGQFMDPNIRKQLDDVLARYKRG
jgi:TIR domain-containing protein